MLPDAIQAALRLRPGFLPSDTHTALQRFMAGVDPKTAPDDARLVDAALLWISLTPPGHPRLTAWSCYAHDASRRLHGGDHPQTRRSVLAHITTATDLFTDGDHTEVARAVAGCIADAAGHPGDDEDRLGAYLTAFTGLHALGHCDYATDDVSRFVHDWQDDHLIPGGLPSLVVVGLALLVACGRHSDARNVLDQHRGMLTPPGSPDRDLFAEYALSVMDAVAEPHPLVCTAHHQPDGPLYSRHAWSAWLHGDDLAHHIAPEAARTGIPLACRTAVSHLPVFSELPGRFEAATRRHLTPRLPAHPGPAATNGPRTSRHAGQSNAYLICAPCRLALQLGVTTTHPDDPPVPLRPVTVDGRPAWQHPALAQVLWTMLAAHRDHDLHVVLAAGENLDAPMAVITATSPADALTEGPHASPTPAPHPLMRGATSQPPCDIDDMDAHLICQSCRLELVLGTVTTHPEMPDTATITLNGKPCHDLSTPTTAVFRFLTDHPGCDLVVIADEGTWSQYMAGGEWTHTIHAGPDTNRDFGDIDHEQYIRGWPFRTSRPRYRGFDPIIRPSHTAAATS